MPNYRRPRVPGATVFFTVNLATRGDSLLVQEIDRLKWAFSETLKARPCQLDALVILPDHIHAVWTLPKEDSDYSGRWGKIKSLFVRDLPAGSVRRSHRKRGEKGIWQRRFWEHHIRSPEAYRALVQYCWINPVKHGLVSRAADWPYSSIHRDIRLGRVEPEWSGVVSEGEFGEKVG
jgi:putative transposase